MRGTVGLAILLNVTAIAAGAGWAAAIPAAGRTPQASASSAVIYDEDFEQGSGVTTLATYRGTSGASYGASDFWSNPQRCNGFVLSDNDMTEPPGFCDSDPASWVDVRAKSYALGLLESGDPHANRAVSSNTAPPGSTPDQVEFQTLEQVPLPAANRFVTFSVDAAATACQSEHPSLRFALKDDSGAEVPVSSAAIDPCTDPRSTSVDVAGTPVSYGRFPGDGSLLLRTRSVGVVMRNANGDSDGNDGAFDNIRILDVTPQLSAAFVPASGNDDGVTSLVLTVTNTGELASKTGASFTILLPAGMAATSSTSDGSCTGTRVSSRSHTLSVSDVNLQGGQHSCSVVIPVATGGPGSPEITTTYTLHPRDFSALFGVNAPRSQARFTDRSTTVTPSSDSSPTPASPTNSAVTSNTPAPADAASSSPGGRLASTGFSSRTGLVFAALMVFAGGTLITTARGRRQPGSRRERLVNGR